MQTLGDQGRLRQAAGARDDVLLQRLQRVRPGALREFGKCRVQPQQMIDRSAERRLAAVDQPLTGGQRAEMRSPDPVDESRLIGKRHAARRRAEDQRQTPARIGRHVACTRPQRAGGAGVRIDKPSADRGALPQGHRRGGLGRQSSPERRARGRHLGADACVMIVFEEAEADLIEEFVRPALLMREIAELAGRRAGRADQTTRWRERTGNR